MNRIDNLFKKFESRDDKPLLSYVSCTDPSLVSVLETAELYLESGIDFFEMGMPSIFPWLDGSTIQLIHREASLRGVTTDHVLKASSLVREKHPEVPLIPMTTYSTVYSYGIEEFCRKCADSDVDGVIIPNYPLNFADDLHEFGRKLAERNIYFINFVDGLTLAPEGAEEFKLLEKMIKSSRGFIFMPSYAGITGGKGPLPIDQIRDRIARVKKIEKEIGVETPVLVGFGITRPEQVRKIIEAGADTIVVSSAVIREIKKDREKAKGYIRSLKDATRG